MKNIKKIIFAFVLFFSAYNLFSQENIQDFLEIINSRNYVIDFYCDVLKSGNRETIHKFSDIYVDGEIPDPDIKVFKWKWYDMRFFPMENIKIRIDKYTKQIDQGYFTISNHGIYPQICNAEKEIKITFIWNENNESFDDVSSLNWKFVREKEINTFYFNFDGDYLYIFLNGTNKNCLFATFVNLNNETLEQFKNLISTNNCDLSKVTWPHHADGSCDYDGSKKAATVQTTKPKSTTIVAQNKIMTVNENLKLRAGEATTTQVLTVMSAGTKVKILELGKEETIDSINSNWVKVEVISGRDRDGKDIKKKTTGWCYGGYLE